MWLRICLIISGLFLVFWFWFIRYLVRKDDLGKLLVRISLVIVMADCFATLIGQPARYWKNYSICDESSIIGAALLHWHPLAFTLGSIVWTILVSFLISKLGLLVSSVIFFAASLGHSLGAWTWIQPQVESGVKILIGKFSYPGSSLCEEISNYLFCVFLALIFAFVLTKIRKKSGK
jgi:hypothetical protein